MWVLLMCLIQTTIIISMKKTQKNFDRSELTEPCQIPENLDFEISFAWVFIFIFLMFSLVMSMDNLIKIITIAIT